MKEIFELLTEELKKDNHWDRLTTINYNWKNDIIFQNYHKLGQKQKGTLGEYFVERLMDMSGYDVSPPTHTDHDKIINGLKVEIKTSLAISDKEKIIKDKFMFNHIAIKKDWDRLLFCCVNPDPSWGNMHTRRNDKLPYKRLRVYFMDKCDFVDYMSNTSDSENIFKHQQGGKSGDNDDYVCQNFHKLRSLPFVKQLSEW